MSSKVVSVCRNSSSAALIGSTVATIFLFIQSPIQALPAALRLNTPVQATSVNEKDEVGFTPLIHALHDEQTGEVESLLKKGADPNAKDNFGWAALIHAVTKNDSRALAHLLSNGADVNIKDNRGMTALMWAAMQGREKIIKALLDHGADINATASNGATALAFAQSKREGGAAKIIREAGGTGKKIDSSSVPKNVVSPLDTGPKPLSRASPNTLRKHSAEACKASCAYDSSLVLTAR